MTPKCLVLTQRRLCNTADRAITTGRDQDITIGLARLPW